MPTNNTAAAAVTAGAHDDAEAQSIASFVSLHPKQATITQLIKRVRALVLELLPIEVDVEEITAATSNIITPEVVVAFSKAGGDFVEAVPFCLLRASRQFIVEGIADPTDAGENHGRATACQVIARRLVHVLPRERLEPIMSKRFTWTLPNGDKSPPVSALEAAIDEHSTIFLSSSESQYVVRQLWDGHWVQHTNAEDDIDYIEYHPNHDGSLWTHLDPQRLNVPRYHSLFNIAMWFFYLFAYQKTVMSPAKAMDSLQQMDIWEVILYTMTVAYLIQDGLKVYKTLRLADKPGLAFGAWTIIGFMTQALLITAFVLRVLGLLTENDQSDEKMYHFWSFQVLSCAAPLIWLKLVTVFEGYQLIGVMQVVVFRMLRESAFFFILLAVIAVGFAQALYALDTADGSTTETANMLNLLAMGLLGSPEFDAFIRTDQETAFGYPFGLIIFYLWEFLTTIILLNILIALFGTAYSNIYDNATDEFLTAFAGKTIDLIRAPDQFVYPAPFNLIEVVFVAPFEPFLSPKAYHKYNQFVMTIVFFIPLTIIALYEAARDNRHSLLRDYFNQPIPEDDEDDAVLNPKSDDPDGVITKVSFKELTHRFPNTTVTESTTILKQIEAMRAQLDNLERALGKSSGPKDRVHEGGKILRGLSGGEAGDEDIKLEVQESEGKAGDTVKAEGKAAEEDAGEGSGDGK